MDESKKSLSTSSDAHKIDPRYTHGEPVRVAYTNNQAESDLLQNMLLEEGIPSMVKRTRGFDVPDFLAAGPRDIYVPESAAVVAREFLHEVWEGEVVELGDPRILNPWIVAAVLAGAFVTALCAWLLTGGTL